MDGKPQRATCPAQDLLSGHWHQIFGVRCKKAAIICLEGKLVLVGIQQVLSFALDEYSNNLTVDVLILHTPMEEFLWL